MAATYSIISAHGATPTTTETNVAGAVARFKLADNDYDDALRPITRPSTGTRYSYRKSFRLRVDTTPGFSVGNIRFFQDSGTLGAGLTYYAHKKPVANYDQATIADKSAQITTDGGSAVVNASTLTSVSPLVVEAGTMLFAPDTGYGTQDLVEMQLAVTSAADFGEIAQVTFTYRVDEI